MINKYLQKLIKEIKITKLFLRSRSASSGMTYVELIVVLSIFSVLSAVAIYNYGDFQSNVDIKNLTNDIALKIVDAQKTSLNGVLPISLGYTDTWKPSYGISFDITKPEQFVYFVDIDNNNLYSLEEVLDTINITKNNSIGGLSVLYQDDKDSNPVCLNDLTMVFSRPSSSPIFFSDRSVLSGVSYVQIDILSAKSNTSNIKIYSSGRIQTNKNSVFIKECESIKLIETDPIAPEPIILPPDEKF